MPGGRKPGFGHPELRRALNPLYGIWATIISRCENPANKSFDVYGARGIKICKEWREDYLKFLAWSIEHGYAKGLWIDRRDSNGNYEPSNCRWLTPKEQQNNRRNNIAVFAFGEIKTISQWADDSRCVVKRKSLERRLYRGWDAERAITEPTE